MNNHPRSTDVHRLLIPPTATPVSYQKESNTPTIPLCFEFRMRNDMYFENESNPAGLQIGIKTQKKAIPGAALTHNPPFNFQSIESYIRHAFSKPHSQVGGRWNKKWVVGQGRVLPLSGYRALFKAFCARQLCLLNSFDII